MAIQYGRHGSIKIPIYTTTKGYSVAYRHGGYRKIKTFVDLQEAKDFAQTTADAIGTGKLSTEINSLQAEQFLEAEKMVSPYKVTIVDALKDYVYARERLKETSLRTAVDQFANENADCISDVTIEEATSRYVEDMVHVGRSKSHIRDVQYRLRCFCKSFSGNLMSVTGSGLKQWIATMGGPFNQNNTLIRMIAFFNWCIKQRYLPRSWREIEQVSKCRIKPEDVEIYTPKELRDILNNCTTSDFSFVAICAFAGLRSAEYERLEWSDIDVDSGYLKISAHKTKTSQRRLIEIMPNLREWIAAIAADKTELHYPNKRKHNYISKYSTADQVIFRICQKGIKWKSNALRHSWISYMVALTKDVAGVSLQAGNSPKQIFAHYLELVRKEQAEEWFSIMPSEFPHLTQSNAIVQNSQTNSTKIHSAGNALDIQIPDFLA